MRLVVAKKLSSFVNPEVLTVVPDSNFPEMSEEGKMRTNGKFAMKKVKAKLNSTSRIDSVFLQPFIV